jgi:hypothetical protein
MSDFVLRIRDSEYALPEVRLTGDHAVVDGEDLLSFNLAAVVETENVENMAGLAINCISIQGLSSLTELSGQIVSLGAGEHDPMNNGLSESVIVEESSTLELERLVLRFGEVNDGGIEVRVEATCFSLAGKKGERNIPVRGRFLARVGKCRERLTL